MGYERFHPPDETPDEDHYAAVGILHGGDGQLHVALTYETSSSQPHLLELRSHLDLNFGKFHHDGSHGLAVYWPNGEPIPEARLRSIAATCRRIASRHQDSGLPYSFALESSLDDNGQFIRGETELPGFTCATLVLAVFDAVGLPLLEDDWPVRDEDQVSQRHLVAEIRGGEREKFEQLIGEVPRYQPAEVAAGALQDGHPAGVDAVADDAERIRICLTRQ